MSVEDRERHRRRNVDSSSPAAWNNERGVKEQRRRYGKFSAHSWRRRGNFSGAEAEAEAEADREECFAALPRRRTGHQLLAAPGVACHASRLRGRERVVSRRALVPLLPLAPRDLAQQPRETGLLRLRSVGRRRRVPTNPRTNVCRTRLWCARGADT